MFDEIKKEAKEFFIRLMIFVIRLIEGTIYIFGSKLYGYALSWMLNDAPIKWRLIIQGFGIYCLGVMGLGYIIEGTYWSLRDIIARMSSKKRR